MQVGSGDTAHGSLPWRVSSLATHAEPEPLISISYDSIIFLLNSMKNKFLLYAVLLWVVHTINNAKAQITLISPYNNYNSVLGMLQNAACISNSSLIAQVNLFTIDANVGNTAFEIKRTALLKADTYKGNITEGVDYFRIANKTRHDAWVNVDIVGPSFATNLNNKNAIGVYTRLRNITNANYVNDRVLDLITQDIQTINSYDIKNMRSQTHVFGEVGATYAHAFLEDPERVWKLGVTAKYMLGIGAFALHTTSTVINYKPTRDNFKALTGDARIVYSKDMGTLNVDDLNIVDFFKKNMGPNIGFGVDVGVVYEQRPEAIPNKYLHIENGVEEQDHSYILRMGLSVTDIGFIHYKAGAASGNYNLTGTNKAENIFSKLDNETLDQYIKRLNTAGMVDSIKNISQFNMHLPMAAHANVDWHIYPSFYINANALINLVSKNGSKEGAYYPTTFSLAPRFETRWFTAFLPASYNEFKDFNAGIGLQAGPLLIGSTSIISNLLKDNMRSLDVFIGLNFPIYKKRQQVYCYSNNMR